MIRVDAKKRARVIRARMARKGITGAGIARQLGITRHAVNAVVGGFWRSPRVEKALAEALGISEAKLWGKRKKAA